MKQPTPTFWHFFLSFQLLCGLPFKVGQMKIWPNGLPLHDRGHHLSSLQHRCPRGLPSAYAQAWHSISGQNPELPVSQSLSLFISLTQDYIQLWQKTHNNSVFRKIKVYFSLNMKVSVGRFCMLASHSSRAQAPSNLLLHLLNMLLPPLGPRRLFQPHQLHFIPRERGIRRWLLDLLWWSHCKVYKFEHYVIHLELI